MLRRDYAIKIDKYVEKIKFYLDESGCDAWLGELRETYKHLKQAAHDDDSSSSSSDDEWEEEEEEGENSEKKLRLEELDKKLKPEEPEKKLRLEDSEFVSKLITLNAEQRQIVGAILSQSERSMAYDYSVTNQCGFVFMEVEFGHVNIVFSKDRIFVTGYAEQYTPPPSRTYETPPPLFCLSENAYLYTTGNIDRVIKRINCYFKEIQNQARFIQRERERYTVLTNDLAELKQELAKIKNK